MRSTPVQDDSEYEKHRLCHGYHVISWHSVLFKQVIEANPWNQQRVYPYNLMITDGWKMKFPKVT